MNRLRALTLCVALLAVTAGAADAYRLFQPSPGGQTNPPTTDYIITSPPTAAPPFVHWDLREMPLAKVPWTYRVGGTPDIDGNGIPGQPADSTAAANAFTAAFNAWEAVMPCLIGFSRGGSNFVGAAQGIALDGHNLLSFAGLAQDDEQCVTVTQQAPAPVSGAAGRPFAPVVSPGPDGRLTTQPRGDDMVSGCVIDGPNGIAETPLAGDDIEIVTIDANSPAGCNVLITAGPNGVLDSAPGGDDRAAVCIVAGPNGNCDTDANNQGNAQGGTLGLAGLFFNNQTGVLMEADIEFNAATTWRIIAQGALPGAGQVDLQQVAMHEIGHAIGIGHPFEADDQQVIPVNGLAPANAVVVNAGPDGVLRTNPVPDDVQVGTNIREPAAGGNGFADTPANNANANFNSPVGQDIMRPIYTRRFTANHTLSADDAQAANWLYTWDLGDAPDNGSNHYQTFVRSANFGRTLSATLLFQPFAGPAQLFGHPPDRYEWLGNDENGSASEVEALVTNADSLDDGVDFPVPMYRGIPNAVHVVVSWSDPARYDRTVPKKTLYFNGYFDWNNDQLFDNGDLQIWWTGDALATASASPNFNGEERAANFVLLTFNVTPPVGAPSTYARFRLDMGEDEGRVANVNGDNAPATGVGQFGEVEDYYVATTNPVTPVVVSRFDAAPAAGGVDLSWAAPEGGSPEVAVYRAATGITEQKIATVTGTAQGGRYHDADVTPGTTYQYRLGVRVDGRELSGPVVTVTTTRVELMLAGVAPNPVAGRGTVTFALPKDGHARIALYGVSGRLERVLADGRFTAGSHALAWDGRGAAGQLLGAGIYFLRLESEVGVRLARVAVVR